MADISGLIVGGIGSIAGILALVYAHIANNNAKRSITIAGESRDLAVEANDLSRRSNTIATGAREIAQDANDISRRAEARETERHDVRWDCGWESRQERIYVLTKRGNDVAHHVKATVRLGKQELVREEAAVTADGARLEFRFGPIPRELQVAELGESRRVGPFMATKRIDIVSVQVDWTTERGTPKGYEKAVPA